MKIEKKNNKFVIEKPAKVETERATYHIKPENKKIVEAKAKELGISASALIEMVIEDVVTNIEIQDKTKPKKSNKSTKKSTNKKEESTPIEGQVTV